MLSFKRSRFCLVLAGLALLFCQSDWNIAQQLLRWISCPTFFALCYRTPEFYCSPAIKLKLEARTVVFKSNLPSFPHLFSIYAFGHSELRVMSRLEDCSVFIPLIPLERMQCQRFAQTRTDRFSKKPMEKVQTTWWHRGCIHFVVVCFSFKTLSG